MPVAFKDFDKDAKDLINKKFQNGQWKVECKAKGPKDQFYVNPICDKGAVSLDINFDCSAAKTKMTVHQSGKVSGKVTMSHACSIIDGVNHTVEVGDAIKLAGCDIAAACKSYEAEVSHEMKHKMFHTKYAANFGNGKGCSSSLAVSFDPCSCAAIGASATLAGTALKEMSAGCRFTSHGLIAAVVANNKGNATCSAKYPIEIKGHKVQVATQRAKNNNKGMQYSFGAQMQCPFSGSTVKLRCQPHIGYGVCFIRKFNDIWEAALSAEWTDDHKPKFGLLLTHE